MYCTIIHSNTEILFYKRTPFSQQIKLYITVLILPLYLYLKSASKENDDLHQFLTVYTPFLLIPGLVYYDPMTFRPCMV